MRVWIFALAALLALSGNAAAQSGNAAAQSPVERGNYLVNTVLTCGNCHTPERPAAAIAGKEFSGFLAVRRAAFQGDGLEHHAGQGDRHRQLDRRADPDRVAQRHQAEWRAGCDGDAVGVLRDHDRARHERGGRLSAHASSRSATRCRIRSTRCRKVHPMPPGADKPYTEAMLDRQSEEGLLPRHHRALHGVPHADRAARPRLRQSSAPAASNSPAHGASRRRATSHRARPKGIGDWTDDEIKRAITQGIRKDGSRLLPPMGYPYYAKMTADDLDAIVAYLRTVPAQE